MVASLIAILSLSVLGIPLALALDRNARGALLIGAAFLYGSGAIFFVLLALSVVHIPWTLASLTVTALAAMVGCSLFVVRRNNHQPTTNDQRPTPHWVDLATLVSLTGYAFYATIAPLWEWDFWAIWGLKARLFLDHGGIDWRFLESRWNTFAHPDYPLLLPLSYDFLALAGGGWSDRWLGVLFVAYGVALLLIARGLAERETSPFFAALLTLALVSIATSRYIGLAEGALIAFGGAGVLFARDALLHDHPGSWRHAAVLLGLGANCKNEGLALLVAVTITIALLRVKKVVHLWPAFLLAAPWIILRMSHTLATDITAGSVTARLLSRLRFTPQILGFLAARLYEKWFWIALLAGVLIAPTVSRMRERFVLLVTAIQLAFYIGSYFVTPHDIRWHVATSWSRLTDQIAVPLTYVVFIMLAEFLRRGEDARDAEARSEQ